MQDAGIARAFENLQILSKDPKKRAVYEARKMALLDYQNDMYVSGLEGETRGEARGEARKALAMARNLKALGVPMDTIMKASGLTLEEVKKA